MQQSITFAGLLLCISLASAQLSYHLDANTNSYTLQTPNSQQTFTQHFNTRSGSHSSQLQASQSQPEQQIYSTSPQQFANNQNNGQEEINNYYRQQLEIQQQQQQRQAEPNNVYTSYQAPQQRQYEQGPQEQNAYYQQIQQSQLQQQQLQLQQLQQLQQQQQYSLSGQQQQFDYQQPSGGYAADENINQDAVRFSQSQQLKYQQQQQQQQQLAAPNRIQYSPSNEVSHVKFSSGDLNYNF